MKRKFTQVIIATHSVEIISNVEPQNIVVIDKEFKKLNYANNDLIVQNILDNIGSIQNISLIKFANAKKCIFVEGKDMKILSKICNKLYSGTTINIDSLPTIPLGGFSRLNEAFGSSKLFYEQTKGDIKVFCILDSDYYKKEFLEDKMKMATENHLDLHIWLKKEIENYLLTPKVIFRITGLPEDRYCEFIKKYEELVDSMRDDVYDKYLQKTYELERNTGWTVSKCSQYTRDFMKENWTTLEMKLSLVSGKELISKINKWIKDEYNKHCSQEIIIEEIKIEEIDIEMKDVIEKLVK